MKLKNCFVLSSRTVMGVLAFSLMGVATSCSSGDSPIDPVTPVDSSQPITFTTNINSGVSTRAYDTTWEADDVVGIFMLDTSDKLSAAHHKANKKYKIESHDTDQWKLTPFNDENNLYYPVNGDEVHFTAYYPYDETITTAGDDSNEVPGTYSVALGDQTSTKTFDLLYHKGTTSYDKTDPAVIPGMEFKHKLSKVIIKIKLDEDMADADISDAAVTIKGIPTTADFDLATGALSNENGADTDVTTANIATIPEADVTAGVVRIHEAIIVPHSSGFTGRTIEVEFMDPEDSDETVTLTYEIPDDTYKAFTSEKKTIYVFTLSRTVITVENVTIADWIQEGADIEENLF
jgi:hypothetical protein